VIDIEEEENRIYVGNIASEDQEDVKNYFSTFGTVEALNYNPKGFAIVTFVDSDSVDKVQKMRPHEMEGGRLLDTRRYVLKNNRSKTMSLYLFGVKSEDVTDEDLKQKFHTYGKITSVNQPRYINNGKKQGFAFVEFEDYDSVDKAVQTKNFTIKGKTVTVQKAR
jgi:RNA recognition motif-containing protein